MPQDVENIETPTYRLEPLEGRVLRPRQVRYQASLMLVVRAAKRVSMAPADPVYLFCTWTPAFSHVSPIERFDLSKSFEKSRIRAERLPPPPNAYSALT